MPRPTERDIMIVQDKLAELYATLSAAQQEVLDTLMAAGLSLIDDDDTGGFLAIAGQAELETLMHDRIAALREDFRRANAGTDEKVSETHHLRWDLTPLLDWFHRPQPRPA